MRLYTAYSCPFFDILLLSAILVTWFLCDIRGSTSLLLKKLIFISLSRKYNINACISNNEALIAL